MLEIGEPVGVQFLPNVAVDVIQDPLHIFYRLVYGFLLGHHLLLPARPQKRSLLDQAHNFLLLLTTGDDLLLAVRILQYKLTRRDLHLIIGGGGGSLMAFFLIGIVVIFDEQVDAALKVHHQILRIPQGQFDIEESLLTTEFLTCSFYLVALLFSVVHLHEEEELITALREAILGEEEGLHRGGTIEHDEADILRGVYFGWVGDDIEHGDECFADHQVLRQLIGQVVVGLVLQELDELAGLERGVVVDADAQLELLAAIHLLSAIHKLIQTNTKGKGREKRMEIEGRYGDGSCGCGWRW